MSAFRVFLPLFVGVVSLATCGCESKDAATEGRPLWVATTGQVHDALRRIVPDDGVELKLLCGPGVDPHSYAASAGDAADLERAQAIFCNGFHLEAQMHDLLYGRYADKTFTMADHFPADARLDWVENGEIDPDAPYDPHIWNHLPGWEECVKAMADHAGGLLAASTDEMGVNAEQYVVDIRAAHQVALDEFRTIPIDQRIIVSAHDAFNYFANVYEFETVAVLGIGNNAEADIATMRSVAETVTERRVPVIFLETITNPKVSEALAEACTARGWGVTLSDEPLYSDALGSQPPVDTFLGAFRHNVRVIAAGLTADTDSDQDLGEGVEPTADAGQTGTREGSTS